MGELRRFTRLDSCLALWYRLVKSAEMCALKCGCSVGMVVGIFARRRHGGSTVALARALREIRQVGELAHPALETRRGLPDQCNGLSGACQGAVSRVCFKYMLVSAMTKMNRTNRNSGGEMSSRRCFATPTNPLSDCSLYLYRGLNVHRESLGVVPCSRAIFCRPDAKPDQSNSLTVASLY